MKEERKYTVVEEYNFLSEKVIAICETNPVKAILSFYINGTYQETLNLANEICDKLNAK